MLANDLAEVLLRLYDAGASRVPAADIDWEEDHAPAINRAISMQYVIHRDTPSGREFSLTESGYRAIRKDPPNYLSMSRRLRAFFNLKFYFDP